jgi:hypothetical protein
MRMLHQIRQNKANEVILSEFFIRVKGINHTPLKWMVTITFKVPIILYANGGTASPDEGHMKVSWYL